MTVTVQTLESGQQAAGAGRNLLTLPDSVMMYVVIHTVLARTLYKHRTAGGALIIKY